MSDHPSSKRQSNAVNTDATCHNVIETRPWADLPRELLSKVADGLAMIELLGFRGTCKNWRSAASTASAEIESSRRRKPWFLAYQEGNPNCQLFNPSGKMHYSLHLPEVAHSTCLASSHGWLLLFYQGWYTFFFCPFSKAIIELPNFPHWDVSNHVAAFSAPPTSKDCVVCVLNRKNEIKVELNVLERGKGKWKKVSDICTEDMMEEVTGAGFGGTCFCFLDKDGTLLTYSLDKKKKKEKKKENFEMYTLVDSNAPSRSKVPGILPAIPSVSYESYLMGSGILRTRLRVGEDVSISTRGTCYRNTIVHDEKIEASKKEGQTWKVKGIWIHPRFHEVPPKQRW